MTAMVIPIISYIIVITLTVVSLIEILNSIDINHFKLAVTFFAISIFSVVVMTHIIIKNRAEIKELIINKDEN